MALLEVNISGAIIGVRKNKQLRIRQRPLKQYIATGKQGRRVIVFAADNAYKPANTNNKETAIVAIGATHVPEIADSITNCGAICAL